MRKFTRREIIRSSLMLGALAAFSDGLWIEPGFLRMRTHQVPILNAPKNWNARILHIADLHYDQDMTISFLEEAFTLGLSSNPDFVVITGDFISGRLPERINFARFLKAIATRRPTFATMGNHDGGRWVASHFGYKDSSLVRRIVEDSGMSLLHNRSIVVPVREHAIRLVGLGDAWADEFDAKSAFDAVREDESIVVLSHNPDTKDNIPLRPWHLMLSGHTHGGQLRVPIVGATPFAPVRDKRYVSGLNSWGDRWIHTTQGVATSASIRFNCRPEVSVIDLVAA